MTLRTLAVNPEDVNAVEELYAALLEDGAVIVEGLFAKRLIDTMSTDIHAALEDVPWCNTPDAEDRADFLGRKTKRLHGVFQYSSGLEDCATNSILLRAAERWLGHSPQFNTGEVMAIGPGEKQQAAHRDAGTWYKSELPGELLFSINLALTDFTEDNGATMVAPGSHQWPPDRRHTAEDFVPAVMEKGSALIYAGSAVHGGGANRTDETRIGLYLGFIPFWLQAQENTVATHPPGFLDTLKPQTRKLLTYRRNGFHSILGV